MACCIVPTSWCFLRLWMSNTIRSSFTNSSIPCLFIQCMQKHGGFKTKKNLHSPTLPYTNVHPPLLSLHNFICDWLNRAPLVHPHMSTQNTEEKKCLYLSKSIPTITHLITHNVFSQVLLHIVDHINCT